MIMTTKLTPIYFRFHTQSHLAFLSTTMSDLMTKQTNHRHRFMNKNDGFAEL